MSEITLPTDELRTAVCCLSSFNLEYYDDWKDHPQFVSDVVEFLDNVLEYFIQNAPASMSRAIYSAKRERSIGLGVLGFHALLQSKGIPFESALAVSLNKRIWKKLNEEATLATKRLAVERGACPDYEDAVNCGVILEYGPVRNSHLFAVAPTASSSIIMGNTSPSVEPYRANIFVQKTLSGSHVWKNKFLERLLEKHGKNTQEVWDEIIANEGSVQSLTFLDAYEKDTFKTSREIDQQWIIQHAADRQEYIDQAQSINLFVSADVSIEYLHRIHMMAWKRGLKTLYYLRSTSIRKADKVGQKTERVELKTKGNDEECLACQ